MTKLNPGPGHEIVNEVRRRLAEEDPLAAHAKWLFSAAATVGTLGGAFQLLGELSTAGKVPMALAVFFTGLSLAFATVSLTPDLKKVLDERTAVSGLVEVLEDRRSWLRRGSYCFAAALVLAGVAPLISTAFG